MRGSAVSGCFACLQSSAWVVQAIDRCHRGTITIETNWRAVISILCRSVRQLSEPRSLPLARGREPISCSRQLGKESARRHHDTPFAHQVHVLKPATIKNTVCPILDAIEQCKVLQESNKRTTKGHPASANYGHSTQTRQDIIGTLCLSK